MPDKKVLILIFFLSISGRLLAQSEVYFTLLDFKSGVHLQGVPVQNLRTRKIQVSDKFGKVYLVNYMPSDTLSISCVNYSDYKILPNDLKFGNVIRLFPLIISMAAAETVFLSGHEVSLDEAPQSIEVIGLSRIKFKNPQTSAQMLESSGKIMVQRSQMGGGSPILRGFEANKVLLVVDGVRMNNAIYRSGHLQNAITIDNNILRQTEVIFGPNSVLYGSDALGGVIHFRTKNPSLSEQENEEYVTGSVMSKLSSANQEKTFHFDVSIGNTFFGSLTSITKSDFGNLRMGKNRAHGDSLWGLVPFYAKFENGKDLMLRNPDPTVQRGTTYGQMDLTQKFLFQPSNQLKIIANFQYSTSTDVPRFDKLNDLIDGELKWAEWNYGPQNRLLFSLSSEWKTNSKYFDDVVFTFATQKIDEDRLKRRFGNPFRITQQEDLWVQSINTDFEKNAAKYKLNYGLEFTHNKVTSSAFTYRLGTAERDIAPTRYPNGGSSMGTSAAYASFRRSLNPKLKINAGTRYSHTTLAAKFISPTPIDLPFESLNFGSGALTGSIGLIYQPDSTWQINFLLGSGYRSPNVDDFGKVREKNGFVVVPNDGLKPEYAYNAETTIIKRLLDDKMQFTATGFYTLLKDAIVQRDFTLNGNDSLWVDGELARIQANTNARLAVIYGYYVGLKTSLSDEFHLKVNYNFTFGLDRDNALPLAHIPPVFGSAELEYHTKKFRGELEARYSGAKNLSRYAPGSTDNYIEALPEGTPKWWTLNLNTSYYISTVFEAQFGIENIFDQHYKVFASGLSAPGRNFILALRGTF